MTECSPQTPADTVLAHPSKMDATGVKETFHYMTHLYEQALQEFVQFCTFLPGFSKLPIVDQESIIKSKCPRQRCQGKVFGMHGMGRSQVAKGHFGNQGRKHV